MKCDICGAEDATGIKVELKYKGLTIQEVPAVKCLKCKGNYFQARTLQLLEEIKGRELRAEGVEEKVISYQSMGG